MRLEFVIRVPMLSYVNMTRHEGGTSAVEPRENLALVQTRAHGPGQLWTKWPGYARTSAHDPATQCVRCTAVNTGCQRILYNCQPPPLGRDCNLGRALVPSVA